MLSCGPIPHRLIRARWVKPSRHYLQSNLLLPFFGALGSVLATTGPSQPACQSSLKPIVQTECPYMIMLPVLRWRVGSTLKETALPCPFYFYSINLRHRIRINTEKKGKVTAAVWGTEYIQFLACASYFALYIG